MSDWTVSVVSPSKAFALPTSRVAFAATTNPRLRQAMAHYRTVFSFGRVPQIDEVMATAAICLTPQPWLDSWTQHYHHKATRLAEQITDLNHTLGVDAFHFTPPQGGWYITLDIDRALFPPTVTNGIDAFAVALHYATHDRDSGIGMLPGELFGYGLRPDSTDSTDRPDVTHRPGPFTFRGSLAVDDTALAALVQRLHAMATTLRSPSAPAVVDAALRRARTIADIDSILAHRQF